MIKSFWILLNGKFLAFKADGTLDLETVQLLQRKQATRQELLSILRKSENIYLVDEGNLHIRLHHDQAINLLFWNDPEAAKEKLTFEIPTSLLARK